MTTESKEIVELYLFRNEIPLVFPRTLKTLHLENCELKNLPPLPDTLERLLFNKVTLGNFPTIPKSLVYLECNKTEVERIPELPDQLIFLSFTESQSLKKLPKLPKSLTRLDIHHCEQIEELPILPENLVYLNFCNTNVKEIKHLPKTLECLKCSITPIERLPDLPNGLTELDCSSTEIKELPKLPEHLLYLHCEQTEIKALPQLPKGLLVLNCGGTQIRYLPNLPETLQELTVIQTFIKKLEKLSHLGDLITLDLTNCCELEHIESFPKNLVNLIMNLNDKLLEIPKLPLSLESLVVRDCMLSRFPKIPGNLMAIECDGCLVLKFSENDLPINIEKSISNCPFFEGIMYSKKNNVYYHNPTFMVVKSSLDLTVKGFLKNGFVQPIDKDCINLCKQHGFEYEQPIIQEAKSIPTCVICLINQPSIALINCGHLVYCNECYTSINNLTCPKCRKENKNVIKIYL